MKRINGYPNYSVTEDGRIWTHERVDRFNRKHGGHFKTPYLHHNGYYKVMLTNKDGRKKLKVHRIVAEHYIPNPKNKPEVNHKDCNRLNNNANNLEWCTHKENIDHAVANGKYNGMSDVGKESIKKALQKKVQCIETGKIYESVKSAAKDYNAGHSNISSACKYNKKCAGMHWKYI